jgi:hypothetical protein
MYVGYSKFNIIINFISHGYNKVYILFWELLITSHAFLSQYISDIQIWHNYVPTINPRKGITGHSHIYSVWGNPSLWFLDIILQNVQNIKTHIYANDTNTTVMWSDGKLEKYLQQEENPEKNMHQTGCIFRF